MKVAERTIIAIQKLITGDATQVGEQVAPYQSGPDLVQFFNELGFNHRYSFGGGFPSRWKYCEDNLRSLNGSTQLGEAVALALNPHRFLECGMSLDSAISFINQYLNLDGYEVRKDAKSKCRVYDLGGSLVECLPDRGTVEPGSYEFMQEQIDKCTSKMIVEDYDGAITNARSLVEATLISLEKKLIHEPPHYNGDLLRLYKRVRKELHIDPQDKDASDVLLPIINGFTSVISGLAAVRNKMSDAHARTYRPRKHHAQLAVNASKTIVDFLLESHSYQQEKRDE